VLRGCAEPRLLAPLGALSPTRLRSLPPSICALMSPGQADTCVHVNAALHGKRDILLQRSRRSMPAHTATVVGGLRAAGCGLRPSLASRWRFRRRAFLDCQRAATGTRRDRRGDRGRGQGSRLCLRRPSSPSHIPGCGPCPPPVRVSICARNHRSRLESRTRDLAPVPMRSRQLGTSGELPDVAARLRGTARLARDLAGTGRARTLFDVCCTIAVRADYWRARLGSSGREREPPMQMQLRFDPCP